MKAKEIHQDDARIMQGKWKDSIYTVDDNRNCITSYILGWEVRITDDEEGFYRKL